MNGTKGIFLTGLVAIEALLFLLPTTLVYVGGVLFSILAFFGGNPPGVTPLFLGIAVFLLLPGYGLYSLWWLVLNHRRVSIFEIPRLIWGGVVVGCLVALLFISPYVLEGFAPPTAHISYADNLTTMLGFAGGPLLVVLTLLVAMRPQK
ncbi:MAG TPA: hypothetical protein ENO19_03990 [Halothiobacillaceae bacterium]|nr:hypothetical protein [Halothiobacillaceae bacterium]